jgi:Do/DeqQ family serine protease
LVKIKEILPIIIISSILTSVLAVWVYDRYFLEKNEERLSKAIAVAEHDLLFSERLNYAFKSSSPNDFISAAESSRKAVVFLRTKGNDDAQFGINSGSGVVISQDGYIATNHHVVKNAIKIDVTLHDNRTFTAKLVGADPSTDLALLKIESQDLDFLIFGNSDSLMIGEWVMAVGNPFRLQSTVTAGIVSAKARSINLLENQGIESFIQTDAAVNPGNSGGALINTRGDLVGICTAIQSNSGKFEGFSFAIPSNLAKKVINDLREYGIVQRGWLGVELENVDNEMATTLQLPEVSGVFISAINKDGSAYDAGLLKYDVIIRANQVKTASISELMAQLALYKPGDKVTLNIIRNGREVIVDAILRNQLNSTDLIQSRTTEILQKIGIELREADKYEKAVIAPEGIIVVSIQNGTIIDKTKMEPGFIIVKVNDRKVSSVAMLIDYFESHKGKTIILEGYYPKIPGEFPYTFVVPYQ